MESLQTNEATEHQPKVELVEEAEFNKLHFNKYPKKLLLITILLSIMIEISQQGIILIIFPLYTTDKHPSINDF